MMIMIMNGMIIKIIVIVSIIMIAAEAAGAAI